MSEKKKSPVYYSSRFWVAIYAAVVMVMITIQLVLGLLINNNVTLPTVISKYANTQLQLPMEVAAWYWLALISLFCGFDRFVDIKTTMHLSSGQMSLGDLAKLRVIMVEALLLYIYALAASFLVDMDFQLAQMLSAFGSSVIIYVTGNKIVKANKYVCKKIKDEDNDGIPDIIQREYERWARQCKKEGCEETFITLDYFLDEHPELEKLLEEERQR